MIASWPRPLGGRVIVEVSAHPVGDRIDVVAERLGSRHSIGFAPDEVGELIAALEEAVGLAGGGKHRSPARHVRLRSHCGRRLGGC